ncbi:MAG: hypothetical protein ACOCRK_01955 [bacterium]
MEMQREKGLRFSFLNLDQLVKEDIKNDTGFMLDTNIDYLYLYKEDMLMCDSIYSRKFGISESDPKSILAYLYTCKCENLLGQNNKGRVCPECGYEVEKKEFPITIRAWGKITPHKIMTYAGLLHFKKILGRKNFSSFLAGKLKDKNKAKVLVTELYDKFDIVLNKFGKSSKQEELDFLLKNKDDFFTSYIPIISKKTRYLHRSENIVPHYTIHDMNSIYTSISGDIQTLRDYCDRDNTPEITENTVRAIQRKYWDLNDNLITEIVGGGKEKILRNEIYATRLPFTARCVIVPHVTKKIDAITIPYDVFRGIFRREIFDVLVNNGMTVDRAYRFIDINIDLKDHDKKILDEILKKDIKNNYVLVNRQPTLKFESTKSLEIIGLEDENVLRIPSVLLDGYNGDHLNKVA